MALPKIQDVELQYMDQWFANLVDTVNYDLQLISGAVSALGNTLTTVDTAPIAYLNDSLKNMVKNINEAFDMIERRFGEIDSRMKQLEQRPGG